MGKNKSKNFLSIVLAIMTAIISIPSTIIGMKCKLEGRKTGSICNQNIQDTLVETPKEENILDRTLILTRTASAGASGTTRVSPSPEPMDM